MSPLPFRDHVYHLHSAERRTLIINHPWHTEYACALYFMSTYVHSTVQSARLWWYQNHVMCVGVCVCGFSALPLAFLCTFHTFLQDLSHTNACLLFCYESSVIWPVCSVRERERERDGFPLLCVCRRDTSRLYDETQCTNGSREGVCAASADWKSSFNSLAWRHTRSLPTIHLQGFSFTIDRHYMQDAGMKNDLLKLFKWLWFFSGH